MNLAAYLALTSHWISIDESTGRLTLRAALIGFHRLKKRHTGVNIAKTILYLLDRADVTLKVMYSLRYVFPHMLNAFLGWSLHTRQCREQRRGYARAGVTARQPRDSLRGRL
jgi:hypothetical protein